MYRRIAFFVITMILMSTLVSCARTQKDREEPSPQEDIDKKSEVEIDKLRDYISKLSLEQKIGQLVMVGIEGPNIDAKARELIQEHYIGGFVLFSKNIDSVEQTSSLINSLKTTNEENPIPLFFAIDEEGGSVSRVPDSLIKIPSSREIGNINSEEFCFQIGSALAQQIKALGFNMDFAPVLDIDSNPKNPIIGSRSFGEDEEVVSRLGIATMRGITSESAISVVKHFPGHGDTHIDSHMDLPVVNHDIGRLKSFELVPFQAAIDAGAEAIMIAHILLPQIESKKPSSLSSKVINNILRKDMEFEGVVITDDLTMGAITNNYSIAKASVEAVVAGCDIILVCHGHENQLEAIGALKKAVKEGIITENRIDESVYRIMSLKGKYDLSNASTDKVDTMRLNERIEAILDRYLEQ